MKSGWIFGIDFCHFWIFVDFVCCSTSIYCLLFVAVNRFTIVSDPMNFAWRDGSVGKILLRYLILQAYKNTQIFQRTKLMVCASWTVGPLLFIPVLALMVIDPNSVNPDSCTWVYPDREWVFIYTSMSNFFLPFLTIICLYCGIIYKAKRANR